MLEIWHFVPKEPSESHNVKTKLSAILDFWENGIITDTLSPILEYAPKAREKADFFYMILQGTSAKIHLIPIGVYLAILIIHIK